MICEDCGKDFEWYEMSDEQDLRICNGCDMDEMHKEMSNLCGNNEM